MSTKKIYLTLTGSNPNYQLKWNNDNGSTWTKVGPTSPSTTVEANDEVEWIADGTIDKVKIKFKKGDIISNNDITGNDGKDPKGKVKSNVGKGLTDTYTIKVKPHAGGSQKEYDPDIKTPPETGTN